MKRILALFLIATFLVSASGCASKTEYDRLIDQKAAVEKKVQTLAVEKENLRQTIASRDMQIKDLANKLKSAEAKVRSIEAELANVNVKTQN